MDKAYLDQNALGFEGDTILKETITSLVRDNDITCIIETGTFMGSTTLQFARIAEQVFTCESNLAFHTEAFPKFADKPNITSVLEGTVDALPKFLQQAKGNTLLFLDAHWGENNPLLRELEIIKEASIKPIIVIHDFKVPDHPELGFDTYNGQDYEWAWIQNSINEIYGADGYEYFYNSEAVGAKRGVIFIKPI
jgi:predicted O-methyltransferase YrrM